MPCLGLSPDVARTTSSADSDRPLPPVCIAKKLAYTHQVERRMKGYQMILEINQVEVPNHTKRLHI
jgi:hypothetical protein